MSVEFEEKPRHVFPRWRPFELTAKLGELTWPGVGRVVGATEPNMWLSGATPTEEPGPSLWKTLDLLGTATIEGRLGEFTELIASVRRNPLAPEAAKRFLEPDPEPAGPPAGPAYDDEAALRDCIRTHRRAVGSFPNDAIGWIDLARAFTTAGSNRKARRAVNVAVQLAPDNRFVLRSAARFFIHTGEPDMARWLLGRAAPIARDPWLMASEIAIASSLGSGSRLIRRAREVLKEDVPPRDLSELAAALGSLEAESGSYRMARRLLRRSLEQANENSVAQIRWLNREYLGGAVDVSDASPPLLHEANAKASLDSDQFVTARDEVRLWLQDQPFASAPATMYSYILVAEFSDWEEGRKVAERGLISNQGDAALLNNLAVCLMELGQITKAQEAVTRMQAAERGAEESPVHKATRGMLEFRRGNPSVGRSLYLDAIEDAREQGSVPTAIRAAMHLAIEELTAGSDQCQLALNRLSNLGVPDGRAFARLRERINDLLGRGADRPRGGT